MNLVVLFGVLSSDPTIRQLPSGESLISLQVTTSTSEGRRSVPVSMTHSAALATLIAGDEVAVIGTVERRFFRSGGLTRSATEVKASSLVSAGDRRRVKKLLTQAAETLEARTVATT